MKFLYFTDLHIRGTAPENRIDNFIEALLLKCHDIVDITHRENVEAILMGGDFFDRALLSPAVVREFTLVFREAKVPIYVNQGNHDELGHSPESIDRTMLGLVRTLAPEFRVLREPIVLGNVEIFATPYCHGLDSNLSAHIIKKSSKAFFTFHLIHSMLVEKPFIASHVLWEAVARVTEADVVFCSHYHPTQDLKKINNTWFVAPGGITRLSAISENFTRVPQVAIIDTNEDRLKIEYRKLPNARTSEEIFDKLSIQEGKDYQMSLESFVESISLNQFQGENVESIVEAVAQTQKLDKEVTQEALTRVAKARERREFDSIKG